MYMSPTLTDISALAWSMKIISDSSPSSSTLTVFSPNSSSDHKFNFNVISSIINFSYYLLSHVSSLSTSMDIFLQ